MKDYLKRNENDFTESEKQSVLFIANLCPFESGKAVYKARSLTVKFDVETEYDDISLCHSTGCLRTQNGDSEKDVKVMVYPNPSANEVNFVLSEEFGDDYVISICNSEARLLNSYPCKSSDRIQRFSISEYKNGVYYQRINDNNSKPLQGKMVVLH